MSVNNPMHAGFIYVHSVALETMDYIRIQCMGIGKCKISSWQHSVKMLDLSAGACGLSGDRVCQVLRKQLALC